MGILIGYNYSTHNSVSIPVGVINVNDIADIDTGIHTYIDYGTWSISKDTQGGYVQINMSSTQALRIDESYISGLLSQIGLRNSGILAGLLDEAEYSSGLTKYGFYDDFTQNPTFNINNQSSSYPSWSASVTDNNNNVPMTVNCTRRTDLDPTLLDSIGLLYGSAGGTMEDGYLGYIVLTDYARYSQQITITIYTNSLISGVYDGEPGTKGFRPTSARTTKDRPGVGGRGTSNKKNPDYASDTVTQPGAPDESVASAVGSGFINCYKIDSANLAKVGQCLYGSTMLGFLQSLAVNPLDFIISLMVFPCSPSAGSAENIKLGGWLAAASGGAALGFDATGSKLSSQFKVVDFGSVQIPENWGNFLDYSQTTIELYLPFIGSVNIDVSECMGGSINVQYTIDFFTGMCVANVLCERSFPLPSGKLIPNRAQHAYQGNCAIQIPLSAINYGSMIGSLINACTQGITNPVGGFMGIASDAIGGGFRPNVSSKGNIVANAGFCSVLYPYVRITRPITAEPDNYQEVMGYPSYINGTLGECEDLCICDGIDLKGVSGATDNELNRIKQLCAEGVYV